MEAAEKGAKADVGEVEVVRRSRCGAKVKRLPGDEVAGARGRAGDGKGENTGRVSNTSRRVRKRNDTYLSRRPTLLQRPA